MWNDDKKAFLVSIACVISIWIYSAYLSYKPHPLFKLNTEDVATIEILDGTSGAVVEITDYDSINQIIQGLNSVTFQKDKSSKDYEGFRYSTKILDADGQLLEELIINAKDHIT